MVVVPSLPFVMFVAKFERPPLVSTPSLFGRGQQTPRSGLGRRHCWKPPPPSATERAHAI